jgi:hypothetical protein
VTPASGTGTGTVSVTVAANTGAARTATVTIGGQSYTVSQAAAPAPCTFTLSATSVTATGQGGSFSVTLSASATTCAWTASTAANWITVNSASGIGSGVVSYALARNMTGASRSAALTAGGEALTVTQASVSAPGQVKNVRIKK